MTESSLERLEEEKHEKSDKEDEADEDKELINRKEFPSPSLPTVIIMPTIRTLNKGKTSNSSLSGLLFVYFHYKSASYLIHYSLCMLYLQRYTVQLYKGMQYGA